MRPLPFLLVLAGGCRAAPTPVPEAEVAALDRAVREANPPLEGYRATGTVSIEADFFLPVIRRRSLDFVAAAAPGRGFVLLRQPVGTFLKGGTVEGLLWVIATAPPTRLWRLRLIEADGPAPVLLARDLLMALDLCGPLPGRLEFARTESELLGRDGENLYVFDPRTLRLRRRELPGVRIEQEGTGPLPDRLVVRGDRLGEKMTVRVESFARGVPRPETFEPGPMEGLAEEKAGA